MDFVVAGFGFGALLIVIGFVVRDLGPLLWRSPRADADDGTLLMRRGRVHLCQGIANALMSGGGITLLATLVAVLAGCGDRMGNLVVLVAAVISAVVAGALVATAIRVHQEAMPVLTPLGRAAVKSTSLSTPDGGALTSVRRIAKPGGVPAPGQPEQPAQPDPEAVAAEIAAFDPNRLFASEFDHDGDENDPLLPRRPAVSTPAAEPEPEAAEATATAPTPEEEEHHEHEPVEDAAPVDEPALEPAMAEPEAAAPAVHDAAPMPADQGTDEVLSVTVRPLPPARPTPEPAHAPPSEPAPEPQAIAESEPPASAETPSASEPALPLAEPVFRSRLLADIGLDTSAGNGSGFASGLLADVAETEPTAATFTSPLLADLLPAARTADGGDGEVDADGDEPAHKRRSLFSRRPSRR